MKNNPFRRRVEALLSLPLACSSSYKVPFVPSCPSSIVLNFDTAQMVRVYEFVIDGCGRLVECLGRDIVSRSLIRAQPRTYRF